MSATLKLGRRPVLHGAPSVIAAAAIAMRASLRRPALPATLSCSIFRRSGSQAAGQ
jgi:hypothetical protein